MGNRSVSLRPARWALMLALGLPGAALADAHCELGLRLAQFHLRLGVADRNLLTDRDLLAEMARMTGVGTRYALQDHASDAASDTLAAFAQIVADIGTLGVTGQADAIPGLLRNGENRRIILASGAAIQGLGCDIPPLGSTKGESRTGQQAESGGASATSSAPSSMSSQRAEAPIDLTLSLAVLAVLAVTVWAIRRYLKRNRRQSRRIMLAADIPARIGTRTRVLKMMDISTSGMKLRHDGKLSGHRARTMSVQIDGWRKIRIHWSNELYAGCSFLTRLTEEELQRIVTAFSRS